ncbi:hypothetical protein GTO89_08625 [Heliobacterium gestii]|uniref:Glycosyl hydrolase family 32 N-terminal domain-containing protein n=1 Tax=Heliomicrobium gestii TaxID=2699 RepID=A0A845LA56_HELGE|nr:hypothetical protein [Heliomicrobium gestii]MBM7866622.1 putative GH43/DUF377 family glycosyl hydrolase [Heliomicrobium gestii]MZP43098.1 hypothetical protein [Heliomicrobium gestii]
MKWKKKGLIYAPSGDYWWNQCLYTHLPTVDVVDNSYIRVYFASLDKKRYGRIGYIDLDIDNPNRILKIAPEPVLDIGEAGGFDDCGVNPSCIITVNDKKLLYYIGWQRSERIPYMLFAGLAISKDGQQFKKHSRVPILDRTNDEPYIRSATTVINEQGRMRVWYVSALRWISIREKVYPNYVIRHAESKDGVNWEANQGICINFQNDDEFGFGRPWVIKDGDKYRMWYSIRSKTQPYRIGYAESSNGYTWERKDDKVGINRSESGWDSEMVCYPCVVDIKGNRYMFYNGNQHGATGFGYAILEQD